MHPSLCLPSQRSQRLRLAICVQRLYDSPVSQATLSFNPNALAAPFLTALAGLCAACHLSIGSSVCSDFLRFPQMTKCHSKSVHVWYAIVTIDRFQILIILTTHVVQSTMSCFMQRKIANHLPRGQLDRKTAVPRWGG